MEHDQEVKDRILVFMRDRLLQFGFSKVTLDEIASELGISKKTLYKYFTGKEDLALQAIRFHFIGIASEIDAIVSSSQLFTDKLQSIMMLQRRQIGKISAVGMEDIRKHAPQLWKEIETIRRERLLSKIQLLFQDARRERVFRSVVDDRIVMMMMLACVDQIANPDTAATLSLSIKDVVQTIFQVLFGGALTDEARAKMPVFDTPVNEASV
jgi:AcrR family transcriptional regulator